AAEVGDDVNALEPPKPAVAPVAPLPGDGRLADGTALGLGNPVAQPIGVGQGGGDAPGQDAVVEHLRLALQGQGRVESGDHVVVVGSGGADDRGRGVYVHHRRSLRRWRARRLASWRTRISSSVSPSRPSRAILARISSSRASSSSSGYETAVDGLGAEAEADDRPPWLVVDSGET